MSAFDKPTECVGYAAYEAGGQFAPFTFTRRACGDDDVVIDIKYAGICHSDIHQARQEWGPAIFPMVPGILPYLHHKDSIHNYILLQHTIRTWDRWCSRGGGQKCHCIPCKLIMFLYPSLPSSIYPSIYWSICPVLLGRRSRWCGLHGRIVQIMQEL